MFPRVEYLHWVEGRAAAAEHDLGTTNQGLGPALERLGDRPDPADGASLDERLAAELGVPAEQLFVTAGASHANFLALAAALGEDGDEVIVESPGYDPLAATPRGLGATVSRFERPQAEGYALDPGRVTEAMTDDTALVVLTDRHNPSGCPASAESLETVADAAIDHGARVLVDEVYALFGTGPAAGPNFGAGTAAGRRGMVVSGSLTKFFGLGELRIGWLVADRAFLERAREVWAHVPTVADVSKRLAGRLLDDRTGAVARARAHAAANAALLASFLAGRDDLDGDVYGPCPFAFPRYGRADGDRVAEAAWEAGVLVIPGRFFGAPGRFRVAAAADPAVTDRALDALGGVLDDL